jgi:hypothetical protein
MVETRDHSEALQAITTMNGNFTLRPQTVISTIYGFHVPERVLAQLLPAVIANSASLQLSAANGGEHQLRLSDSAPPLAVTERERGELMPDCYVLADAAAFEWQGPLVASLSVTAPPVDNTERDRMRRITTAKQLELKRHQTTLMEKPSTRRAAKSSIVKKPRIEPVAVAPPTVASTTSAASVISNNLQESSIPLLNALALAPLSRRFVNETFPNISAATLGDLADFKGNAWHLRFDKFDLVDTAHPFFAADEKKRAAVQARIHQSRQIRGLTVDLNPNTSNKRKTASSSTTAAATATAALTDYQKLWLQHNELHAELEQRRMRFASMATMYFDKSTLSFQPDIDVAGATRQLDREEQEFREKLAQYNQLIRQLVDLERQQ